MWPAGWVRRCRAVSAILEDAGRMARTPRRVSPTAAAGRAGGSPVRLLSAGEDRPRPQPAARAPRRITAHADPLRQRGPARAAGRAARRGKPGGQPRHPRHRGPRRRFRDADPPGAHRPRDLPSRPPTSPPAALPPGRAVGRHGHADRGRLRRASRSRDRHLSRDRDDHGGGGHDRGGDRRVRGR